MIHKFTVENFYSINEEQELDFTSTKKYSNSFAEYEDKYISNVNCFLCHILSFIYILFPLIILSFSYLI